MAAEPGGLFARIEILAGRVASLRGWRRHVLATSIGVLATPALPPVHAFPLLYVSFSVLVWLLPAGLRRRTAFATGWWFGLGYFTASLYWIGFAPYTLSADLIWVVPFASLGLPLGLSIFYGVATLAATWRWSWMNLAVSTGW